MAITSPFTRSQSIVLVLLRPVSAILSLVGSSVIISKVTRGSEPHERTPKHRILVAMSIYDILHTSWSVLSTIPSDKERAVVFGAMGNRTTCEAFGFFIQLSQVIPLYTAALSLYYMLRISYKISDQTIAKFYLEVLAHVVIGMVGWTLSIAGLILRLYNPIVVPELGCWVATYPAFCNLIADLDCERGAGYERYVWIFSYNILIISFFIILLANIRIFWTVFYTERRLAQNSTLPPTSRLGDSNKTTITTLQRPSFRQQDPYRQSRVVLWNNVGYVAASLVTFIWPILAFLVSILAPGNVRLLYALTVLLQVFYPLQGFWNCLVFLQQPIWCCRELPLWCYAPCHCCRAKDCTSWFCAKAVSENTEDKKTTIGGNIHQNL